MIGHILWFRYLLMWSAGPLFLISWFRKWWQQPWATYISHELVKINKDKEGLSGHRAFVTVRHYRWYPPFSAHDVTYLKIEKEYKWFWVSEKTGREATYNQDLENIFEAGVLRQIQTDNYTAE